MGQRHQVYVALPPCSLCEGKGWRSDGIGTHKKSSAGQPECNGCAGKGWRSGKVIGIHHQWLYGRTALRMLRNFLVGLERNPSGAGAIEYGAQAFLNSAYSFDADRGYAHGVHTLEQDQECSDPTRADNNDGITIIDLRALTGGSEGSIAGQVKVALMSLGQGGGAEDETLEAYRPVSPLAYVDAYYPGIQRAVAGGALPRNSEGEVMPAEIVESVKADALDVARVAPKILTITDVRKIFPAMVLPRRERRVVLEAVRS